MKRTDHALILDSVACPFVEESTPRVPWVFMLILGLSSLFKNDTAAVLVRDGVIEAAIENHKLQPSAPRGIPEAAIQYCLSKGGVTWRDIDVVAIASDPFRGWGRRAFSRRRLSPVAPAATGYHQGRELSRLAREWTGIRICGSAGRVRRRWSASTITIATRPAPFFSRPSTKH